ncbi:MAG: putative membrane protein required for N-linked glycosylation [halophilic archaeon J07HX64]|jgi:Uncharacterized membrane protein, required for N-linked glycosylation|nr:MAG: putative membrane protein required for N-linked glycosylation [halophilic archaeon J07HX64]
MSNWQDQLGGEGETKALVDWLAKYYHYPVLLAVIGFALWNRVRNYSNFIVNDEILYTGNDPWYHMRSTEYVINNFPETMPFDPWTFFPQGTANSQFGTIFDQLIALVALVVGAGSPSQGTGRFVLLISPAIFGVMVALPAYVIGRRLGGRFGGIISVMFIALAPDRMLDVSLAGFPDHQVAEVLFMGFAVVGLMVALRAAERELPVHELLLQREFGLIRGTLGWSLLAGVAFGVYMWVWPPGVWLYGIFGVFFIIHMSAEHVRGRSPEHTAFVGATVFATAGLLQLAALQELGLSATSRTLLQPAFGLAGAVGIVALAWFSQEVHRRERSALAYPAGIVGSIIGGLVIVAVLSPGLFDFAISQYDRAFGATIDGLNTVVWFADISIQAGAESTIGEGSPGSFGDIRTFYQFAAFTALLGAAVLIVRQVLDDRPRGEELLLVVVSIFMIIATFTQIRFAYYLTIVIGGLNAALVGSIMRLAGTPDRGSLPETYQVLTIMVVLLVMFVPLLGVPLVGGDNTAIELADSESEPGSVTGWGDSLDWMAQNTPEPGTYANPDGEPMEYYGQYERTDSFDYPDGAYGVLSWWDYGHWITAKGERIPNANPFQQNIRPAAEFLLAQDESEGLDILEEEFQDSDTAKTQYVMIDALMVETEARFGGKFFAPADFASDFERGDFYRRMTSEAGDTAIVNKQNYYESMMVRLYHYHGSNAQPDPFVTQWAGQETRDSDGRAFVEMPQGANESAVEFVDNISAARNITENDPTNQIGGLGASPAEEVPALEHFRLVYDDRVPAVPLTGGEDVAFSEARDNGLSSAPFATVANQNLPLMNSSLRQESTGQKSELDKLFRTTPSFTKTFERVPGATIRGSLPDNATEHEVLNVSEGDSIGISVPMNMVHGEQFTYSQTVTLDENLEFNTTVPYSTTGYDEYGPEEGYTNVSVRANSSYNIQTSRVFDNNESAFVSFGANVNVTEGQVIGEEDPVVEVQLEERTQPFDFNLGGGGGSGDDSGSDSSDSGSSGGDGSNGGDSGGDGSNGGDSGGDSSNGGDNSGSDSSDGSESSGGGTDGMAGAVGSSATADARSVDTASFQPVPGG